MMGQQVGFNDFTVCLHIIVVLYSVQWDFY